MNFMKKNLQVMLLTGIYMGATTELLQADEKDNKYQAQMVTLQQQSFIDQFNCLAAAGVANISTAQIATISTSIIPFISNDQIVQFTPTHIAAFTVQQIPAFLSSQIAAFTTAQMVAITAIQVAALTPAHINAMSNSQLEEVMPDFSVTQIQSMVMPKIQDLSNASLTTMLANLTEDQVEFITPAQITALGITIAPRISDLSPAQFLSLSQVQIQAMTLQNITDQLGNISTTQIGYLSIDQLKTITTALINLMTKDQLNAFQTRLQDPLLIAAYPQLGTQLSSIDDAPGTGVDLDIAKKKKNKGPKYAGSQVDKDTGVYYANKKSGLQKANKKTGVDKTNRDSARFLSTGK